MNNLHYIHEITGPNKQAKALGLETGSELVSKRTKLTMLTMGLFCRTNSDPVSPATSRYTMKEMTAASTVS